MKPLVTRKESARYPGLFVRKYTKRVFFDNLWDQNPELLESRGHVELADGTVVVQPFTKIFNRFENGVDIARDEQCMAVRKVNGFMVAATWVEEVNDVVISTTGSLDSEFVKMADEFLGSQVKKFVKTMSRLTKGTYLFEVVHPSDPHIIPEEVGAYLIGFRDSVAHPYFSSPAMEMDLDAIANAMNVNRPEWKLSRFSDIVDDAKYCKHEGFVVYGQTSRTALKIKSPYYLFLKAAARRKDIFSLNKKNVDEEFYSLIAHLTSIGDTFTMMNEQERLSYMSNWIEEN